MQDKTEQKDWSQERKGRDTLFLPELHCLSKPEKKKRNQNNDLTFKTEQIKNNTV